ncbi:hypothetical protein LCI01_05920 [Leuconostoc citreum]|uniref:hypothetical protein n=1 Tax=Leuconostoc citreum TaxID=33964 RepID=UPI00116D34DD|nr:hypothetical protein [Leuconostoc citreum]GEK60956.1 hypothetical protein LCI01_05920 [Leuconostoc citreum]
MHEFLESDLRESQYLSKYNKKLINYHHSIELPFLLDEQIKIINSHYSKYNRDWKGFCLALILVVVWMILCSALALLLFFSVHSSKWHLSIFGFEINPVFWLILKVVIIIAASAGSFFGIIWLMDKRNDKNNIKSRNKEIEYYEELNVLLNSIGVSLFNGSSVNTNVVKLDTFINDIENLNISLQQQTNFKKAKSSDDNKWRATLLVAILVPIVANNLAVARHLFKRFGATVVLVAILSIYLTVLYKLSIKPLMLEFSLVSKIRNIKPTIYKLRYKIKHPRFLQQQKK